MDLLVSVRGCFLLLPFIITVVLYQCHKYTVEFYIHICDLIIVLNHLFQEPMEVFYCYHEFAEFYTYTDFMF